MVTEPTAVPEDSSPTTFSEGAHRRWRRTWLVGSLRTGHRGVCTRCRGALVLASLLVIASAGACGTSSGNESSKTRASVAPIDPAELADPGPHGVGTASLSFPNGDDEPLSVIAFYPAIAEGSSATRDAEPDPSAAPYPVVLGNTNMAEVVGLHLASHGFVFLALSTPLVTEEVDGAIAFSGVLDGVAALDQHLLTGIADTDHAGVMGYSGESLFALMLAGARIDPDHYAAVCADPPEGWGSEFLGLACSEEWWETILERADLAGITTSDGLWESQGDDRIRASMPMGPRGFYLTGPDGLASATAPILLVVGGEDTERLMETAEMLQAYPTGLAEAITFVGPGAGHLMIFNSDVQAEVRRLAVAFLTLHLKGTDQYSEVLTPEFIGRSFEAPDTHPTYEKMIWGVPEGSGY